MNVNGELTETENVIFYVSYGVLTEFLRMNVILRPTYFCNGQRRYGIRNDGNHAYSGQIGMTPPAHTSGCGEQSDCEVVIHFC